MSSTISGELLEPDPSAIERDHLHVIFNPASVAMHSAGTFSPSKPE
jgi:hypothetical protein